MALSINATITVSCEESEEETGPTIVHSTGVQNYRVQPEIIRILQESCSNEKLCDHEKGVQCTDPAAHILSTFGNVGFTVTAESTSGSRKIWMLTKTGEGNSGDASGDQGGHDHQEEQEEEAGDGEEEQGEE